VKVKEVVEELQKLDPEMEMVSYEWPDIYPPVRGVSAMGDNNCRLVGFYR